MENCIYDVTLLRYCEVYKTNITDSTDKLLCDLFLYIKKDE